MKLAMLAVVCVAGGLVGSSASLAAGEKHTFRFNVGYILPTGDLTERVDLFGDPVDVKVEFESAIGVGIGYEYRVTDLVGVDVGLSYFGTDVEAGAMGVSISDGGSIMPLTAGAMFHLTRDSKFDFYVGPEVAYVSYGSVRLPETDEDVEFEDEFTFGAKAGIAVPFNEQWSFNASVEYLVLTGEVKDTDPKAEIDPNPLILSVGAALRF